MKKLTVNIFSEKFIGEANGVYTAFLEAIDALKKRPDIVLRINKSGEKSDVIHAHSIGVRYIMLALKYRKKLVVSAHVVPDSFIGSLIFSKLWQPIAKLYLRYVFNLARIVIAVSPIVKDELQAIGVTSRIEVLCNSVDRNKFKVNTEAREKIREKYGLKKDDFVVLCVGQIQPRKGIYEFLETARQCPDMQFVWVGGRPFGRLTADYDRLTEEVENAPPNTHFVGIVDFDDMPAHYAMADVYFLPSWQENFAFATIEASAVRLPLLLKDNKEYPPTLFTHYLKASDADGYASELKKLSTDPNYYKNWQEESDILASKYEIGAYTDKLVGFYREVAVN